MLVKRALGALKTGVFGRGLPADFHLAGAGAGRGSKARRPGAVHEAGDVGIRRAAAPVGQHPLKHPHARGRVGARRAGVGEGRVAAGRAHGVQHGAAHVVADAGAGRAGRVQRQHVAVGRAAQHPRRAQRQVERAEGQPAAQQRQRVAHGQGRVEHHGGRIILDGELAERERAAAAQPLRDAGQPLQQPGAGPGQGAVIGEVVE